MKNFFAKSSTHISYCLFALLIIFAFIQFPVDDFFKDINRLYTFFYLSSIAFSLIVIDYFLDYVCWYWVLRRLRISLGLKQSFPLFCSASAAGTLPFVMGTMVRPFLLSNLKLCSFSKGVVVEGIDKLIDMLGIITLLGTILLLYQSPLLAGLFFFLVVFTAPFFLSLGAKLLNRFGERFKDEEMENKTGFFSRVLLGIRRQVNEIAPDFEQLVRSPVLNLLIATKAFGWVLNGSALYILLEIAPIELDLSSIIFQATTLEIIGHASGFPGGIGVIEGALGGALLFHELPEEFLVPVIGIYRITNFWFWIIPGFLSYSYLMKAIRRSERESLAESGKTQEIVEEVNHCNVYS